MANTPVVKGTRLRVTRVDACGLPIRGPRSRVVTEGFITATFSPVMRDAEDLEQTNAEGRVCVADRTPPELKWWNVALNLCGVDTCLKSMMLDWDVLVDWDGKPAGIGDQKRVSSETGVAIEVWSGVGSDDVCEIPTSDDIFDAAASGSVLPYGYWLVPVVKECQLGDIEIGASVSTFTLNGITAKGPRWGRGPYNVVPTDANNTPGRIPATYITKERQLIFLRTTIAPPPAETGCCPLVLPSPYYGETAIDVAPPQPPCDAVATNEIQTVTLTDDAAIGFRGYSTPTILDTALPAAVQTALEALPSIGTGNVTVTGSAGNYVVTFVGDLAELNQPALTLTPAPNGTVAETQAGGVYA